MQRHILRRILISFPLLLGITAVVFFLTNLAPGDPIDALIDPFERSQMTPDAILALKRHYGLDQPMPVRYLIWLRTLLGGNFGHSFSTGQPVAEMIASRVPATLQLTVISLILQLLIGVPLGVISAMKQYSRLDYGLTVLAFVGVSVPNFFLAMGVIFIFAVKLGWLPSYGIMTPGVPPTLEDRLRHLILPSSVLAASSLATMVRYMRASMLEVLHQDYLTTARSKGLRERAVIGRHALRNALLPVITILGLSLPNLFAGSIIIETMFAWPGVGLLAIQSISARDYNVLMAVSLILATLVLLSNLLADLFYAVIDPRIRYA